MKNWPRRKREIRIYRICARNCNRKTTSMRSCRNLFRAWDRCTRSSVSVCLGTIEEHRVRNLIQTFWGTMIWAERWQSLTFISKSSRRKRHPSNLGKKMNRTPKRTNLKFTTRYASLTVTCTVWQKFLTPSVTCSMKNRAMVANLKIRNARKRARNT